MLTVDARLYKKQCEETYRLNQEFKKLHKRLDELKSENDRLRPAHDYYMMLQKAAMEDEAVGCAFSNLVMLVKLSSEDDIPGLTGEDNG